MFLLFWTLLVLQMPLMQQRHLPAGIEAGLQRLVRQEQALAEEKIGLMECRQEEEPDRKEHYERYFKKAMLVDSAATSGSSRWLALYNSFRSRGAVQTLRRLNSGLGDSMLRETDLALDLIAAQVNSEGRPALLRLFSSQWTLVGDGRDVAAYRVAGGKNILQQTWRMPAAFCWCRHCSCERMRTAYWSGCMWKAFPAVADLPGRLSP